MTLQSCAEGLWTVRQEIRTGGLRLPVKSTVVRLGGGGVLVLSPIPELDQARESIDGLGEVRALVAPNALHHLGIPSAQRMFPKARLFGRPSLQQKRTDLRFSDTLGDYPDPLYAQELDQHVVGGVDDRRLDEVLFFHRPSATLIVTDLCFNVRHSPHGMTRFFMKLNKAYGRFGPSRIMRSLIKDRAALRASIDHVLAWKPQRIVVSHGEDVTEDAAGELDRAFAFLR